MFLLDGLVEFAFVGKSPIPLTSIQGNLKNPFVVGFVLGNIFAVEFGPVAVFELHAFSQLGNFGGAVFSIASVVACSHSVGVLSTFGQQEDYIRECVLENLPKLTGSFLSSSIGSCSCIFVFIIINLKRHVFDHNFMILNIMKPIS